MPVIGPDNAKRANAHLRWAERYRQNGNAVKAIAHFGRGVEYKSRIRFGTIAFVEWISFDLTDIQVNNLVIRGTYVREMLKKYNESAPVDPEMLAAALSKNHKVGNKPAKPHETILNTNAAGSTMKKEYNGFLMAIGAPRTTPYIGSNMGPLICIIVPGTEPVINIFQESVEFVRNMAEAVRLFSRLNELAIISALRYMCTIAASDTSGALTEAVESAAAIETNTLGSVTETKKLETAIAARTAQVKSAPNAQGSKEDLTTDFLHMIALLSAVEQGLNKHNQSLEKTMGLKIQLFCQTWEITGSEDAGPPNFSMPSPHFQTCLIVTNREMLVQYIHANTSLKGAEEHVSSFEKLASRLPEVMEKEYKQKLVNVSKLLA
jgi:hypothetical protein